MAMTLNKLHSLFVEQTNVNGSVLTVHYLVKNSPFRMDLQMDGSNVEGLKLKLFTYDTEREVKLAKNEPLTFRVIPSSTTTTRNTVSVEVRIQVLSSSMEGSLFVIVAEKGTGRVSTQPLKVVSKLEQVRAAIKRAGGSSMTDDQSSDDEMAVEDACVPNLKKRKVPVSDQVLHELEVIKKQQQEQFALLAALSKLHGTTTVIQPDDEEVAASSRSAKRRKLTDAKDEPALLAAPSFEQALGTFLQAFASLTPEERITRTNCYVAANPAVASNAAEAGSVLMQSSGNPNGCVTSCPYRNQLNSLFAQLMPAEEASSSSSETSPDFASSTSYPAFEELNA